MVGGLIAIFAGSACTRNDSDAKQQRQQEALLNEATSQVGMPAINNFRERKILKDILELRDQSGLVTYTYLYSEMTGQLTCFGDTIGYPIPYATQFTNPQKHIATGVTLPQADPNGLFSPSSADATWVLMKDPNDPNGEARSVYAEPKLISSPFKLPCTPLGVPIRGE